MIQDIMPRHLDNQYKNLTPTDNDTILFFEGSSVLGKYDDKEIVYPNYQLFKNSVENNLDKESVKDVSDTVNLVGRVCRHSIEDKFTFIYSLQ